MACVTLNNGIERDCNTSMGGVKAIWLADYSDAKSSISASSGQCSITSASGWYRYNTRKNVSSMTSTFNIDEANGVNYVSTELNLVLSRMDATKRETINVLRQAEVYAVVLDNNGNGWALGMDNPVTITAGTGQTGTAVGDGNNYSLTLTDTSNDLPYTVDSTSIELLLTQAG